eukprot:GFUD01017007.1.p1 GENE.GFUD01017007.1~~GFUD01017007.1.p1  ORF type:complete len:205 (+),score=48.83 GFUD01017007.1:51-665(+)
MSSGFHEEKLDEIVSKICQKHNNMEWRARTRSNRINTTYQDLYMAIGELIMVIHLVLGCIERHPKVFKKFGPQAKSHRLETFLKSVTEFREFLEEIFFQKMSKGFPLKLPSEILRLIWSLTQTGENPFNVGCLGGGGLGQKEEMVVRRKLLLVTKGLSIQLCGLVNKKSLRQDDLSVEIAMTSFQKGVADVNKLWNKDKYRCDG